MIFSFPRGEQVLGVAENEGGEERKYSAAACNLRTWSASGAPPQPTKSMKKYNVRRMWLPCFIRQSHQEEFFDNVTSTEDLFLRKDAPQSSEQHDDGPETAIDLDLLRRLGDISDWDNRIRFLTHDLISSSSRHRSFRRHLTPNREQCSIRHPPSPWDKGTYLNKEQPDRDPQRTSYLEAPAVRKSAWRELPSREVSGDDLPSRKPLSSRRSSDGGRSPAGKPRSRERSSKWRTPGEINSQNWQSSVWKRLQSPRGTSESLPPSRKKKHDWQDLSPIKTQRKRNERDGLAKARRAGMHCGRVGAVLCFLLVGFAVFIGIETYPVCVAKLSWVMMSREALLLELVSVSLLVVASISILMLVGQLQSFLTELVIAFILVLYNTALVDLVRCLCFIPGCCLWLSALVLPLFLLTFFVLCQQGMAVLGKTS